jgi:hypothetical protein
MFGQPQRVGNAGFTLLIGEIELVQSKIFSVPQEPQEISGAASSGNDQDVVYSGIHQYLQRVIDHRLVIDRQQMFVRHPG